MYKSSVDTAEIFLKMQLNKNAPRNFADWWTVFADAKASAVANPG